MRYALFALLFATPALADAPRVVTDFGPVQSLVIEVMGDLGQPTALLPSGGDPHDFQLRPSQAQALSDADVVFWAGPALMPALGDALSALAGQAQVVDLLQDGGGKTRPFDEGGLDPHGWLDPANGIAWAGTIAQVLGNQDPANAATYLANATALQTRLTRLDADLAALLAPVKDKPFIVYHDALGYFTDHYSLNVVGAIELGDASSPSAARLSEIQAIITNAGAVCVFPELGRDPKFIAALTEGLTVKVGAAQDLEFLERPATAGAYEALLRDIATGMADCLSQG